MAEWIQGIRAAIISGIQIGTQGVASLRKRGSSGTMRTFTEHEHAGAGAAASGPAETNQGAEGEPRALR